MFRINQIRIPAFLVALASCFLLLATPLIAAQDDSTDSANIDPETIKENIKKRIEQVIKNQSNENKKRTAYLGTLNSVTTNSFSLETLQGSTKQASTSAATVVIELPKNKEVQFADVSIGDYVAALGFVNETTKVLDARRILILKEKPEPSKNKPFYGTLTQVDLKKNTVTLKEVKTSQEKTFKLNSKTDIQITDGSPNKKGIAIKEIPTDVNCLIIYTSSDSDKDTKLIRKMLIKSNTSLIQTASSPTPSPSPSPKTSISKPSTTPKAKISD